MEKFRIGISVSWEKWLAFYAVGDIHNIQWSKSYMTIKIKEFLYGETRYWFRMHTPSLIKQETLSLVSHCIGEEQKAYSIKVTGPTWYN